jgi:histidyl-tRNA synthetase
MHMSLSTQPYKGVRDFYPEDMRVQNYIYRTWAKVCEQFGYEQYDASVLEPAEIYEAKSGQEIVDNEMYTLTDKGERRVALRPEMTPSVARMVAGRRQELAYPVRWYSIPNLLRYERPQRGRLREHWQLNVDIFGVAGLEADHEIISVADAVMQAFGAKRNMYEIRVNSRKFINYVLLDYLGLDGVEAHTISKLIDKMHKLESAEFVAMIEAAMSPSRREAGSATKLLAFLDSPSLDELPEDLQASADLNEIKRLMELLKASGITNARFDSSLMRGFDYYTDIVFEVFDLDPSNNRAMFGGGRYDGLVGLFGVEPVPTVGFGQGDVTMRLFLEAHELLPSLPPETELSLILIGDTYAGAQGLLQELRAEGVRCAVDISGRKLDKQIQTAEKRGAQYVLFVGEKELEEQRYPLKNLKTGEEQVLSAARIVSFVKDVRQK